MTRALVTWIVALVVATAATGATGAHAPLDWKRVEAPVTLAWPRDHGAHDVYRTEWWYATGELASSTGERFGYQLTIFRQGHDPEPASPSSSPLRAKHVFAGHFVLVDLASKELVVAERQRRRVAGLADASETDLDVRLDGWSFVATGERSFRLHGDDREHGLALDLELASSKPLVLHGDGGVSRKGDEPGNASVYASWTRLSTRGTLSRGGRELAVTGESWFDHEWGSAQLGAGVVGWDWFGLRLDDGRELMLYRLRRADGSAYERASATLVEKDGSSRSIPLARVAIEPTSTWTSSKTGARYATRWKLAIAEAGIDVTIAPRADGCEIDGRRSTGVVYWEGPVEVTGSVHGSGYMELTGYASSLAPRF